MEDKTFRDLERGDLIKHKIKYDCERVFVVTGNYGGHITAAATVDMTNPPEWDLVRKACRRCPITSCKFHSESQCTFQGYCPLR